MTKLPEYATKNSWIFVLEWTKGERVTSGQETTYTLIHLLVEPLGICVQALWLLSSSLRRIYIFSTDVPILIFGEEMF